jgi:hypothetical protein
MSSTVQTLAQVKSRTGILAGVVYSCCWSYRFISQLEYSCVEFGQWSPHLWEGAYWPRTLFALWFYIVQMTQWTPEKTQVHPRVLALHTIHISSDDHVKSASSISKQLELAVHVARSSAASAPAACSCKLQPLNKSWLPNPSPAAKVSKTPIRVNPLVYILIG